MDALGRLRLLLLLALALAPAALSCRAREPAHARPATVAGVLRAMTAQYPNPVSVAPAGDRVLVKSMLPDQFELAVIERATGRRIASDLADDTQLAPTWRADGAAIAFVAAHDGRLPYELRLWMLDGTPPRALPAVRSSFAVMRWAPQGTRLAYLDGDVRGQRRRVLVVDTATPEATPRVVVDDVAPAAGFVWAPDGTRLATVRIRDRGAIAIVPVDGGPPIRIEVSRGGEVRALAWSPDGTAILASARALRAEHVELFRVELAGRSADAAHNDAATVRRLASQPGDISGPLYRPDGRGILYHLNQDGEVTVIVADLEGAGAHVVSPAGGTSTVTGFAPAGSAAYVLHVGRTTPPMLYEIALDDGARSLLFAARAVPGLAVDAERVDIQGPAGTLPAYLWRGRAGATSNPAAIIRVHGGPQVQMLRSWEITTEFLASSGYDVVGLNYRGSTGYGASFERDPSGQAGQVADVLAARDYATSALGVPPQRVFLLGHSYGAAIVAEAAAADPGAIGGVILLSLIGAAPHAARAEYAPTPGTRPEGGPTPGRGSEDGPRGGVPSGSVPLHLLAFHGATDPLIAPDDARNEIGAIFGERIFDGPTTSWRVFAREPHSYNRMRTWAEVYASVVEMLDGS